MHNFGLDEMTFFIKADALIIASLRNYPVGQYFCSIIKMAGGLIESFFAQKR